MQRGKSSSSQSTSGSPAKNQFAFDPLLMSPIMKVEELDALSKRSSLDALRAQGEYHPYYQPNTSNISPSRDVKKTLRSTSPSHNANASRRSTSPLSTRSASSPRPVGFGTSASRGHLFNEESFSLVKFRHGEVGDYIKHLMNQGSNNSEGSRSGSRSSSRDRARGPSRSNPSYGNISSSSSPQNNTNNNIGEWYNIYGSDIPQSQPVNSR